jgi:hypothetical protein
MLNQCWRSAEGQDASKLSDLVLKWPEHSRLPEALFVARFDTVLVGVLYGQEIEIRRLMRFRIILVMWQDRDDGRCSRTAGQG